MNCTSRQFCILIGFLAVGCEEDSVEPTHVQTSELNHPTPSNSSLALRDMKELSLPADWQFNPSQGMFDKLCNNVIDTNSLDATDAVAVFSFTGRPESRELSRKGTEMLARFVERPALRLNR